MDKYALGRLAFAAFVASVGGTHSPFDELADNVKQGWEDSARASAGYVAAIGDTMITDSGLRGMVRSLSLSCGGRGYWLECLDGEGRPFDHFVHESQVHTVEDQRRLSARK